MSEEMGGVLPAGNGQATASTVADTYDIDRARRRWKLHQQLKHRQHCDAFDRHLGVGRPGRVMPNWDDYALGYQERRARGLELREAA